MSSGTPNDGVAVSVRDITDDEIAFYEENGWVKLDGLITPELTAQLLSAAEELMDASAALAPDEGEGSSGVRRSTTDDWSATWGDFGFQARKIRINPFFDFTMSKPVGRLAQRIINRERLTGQPSAVRYLEDSLHCKPPMVPGGPSNALGYHQDLLFGTDRVGGFNLWIALDEVTPEQGAMRFLTGSHREGPLGSEKDFLGHYSRLSEIYPFSPPFHYQPGDATVHHGNMVHGSPDNVTDRPRWCYVTTYMPDDCVLPENPRMGMPEPHERFPVVYP